MRLHFAVILSAFTIASASAHAASQNQAKKVAPVRAAAAKKVATSAASSRKVAARLATPAKKTTQAATKLTKTTKAAEPKAAPKLAIETAPAAAAKPGFLRRMLGSLGHPFTTSDAMKATLREAKTERKEGELVEAAGTLAEAPKPGTLMERFRLWRADRALVKASRKALSGTTEINPQEGYDALKLMAADGKMSIIDKMRAGVAMGKSGQNAFATARKLGDRGQVLEAAEMLKYANDHAKLPTIKQVMFRVRLRNQIMQAANRQAAVYKSLPEGKTKEAAFDETMKYLEAAQEVGSASTMDLSSMVPGRLGKMLGGRMVGNQAVVSSMGLSGEEIAAKLEARAAKEQAAEKKAEKVSKKSEGEAKKAKVALKTDK